MLTKKEKQERQEIRDLAYSVVVSCPTAYYPRVCAAIGAHDNDGKDCEACPKVYEALMGAADAVVKEVDRRKNIKVSKPAGRRRPASRYEKNIIL